MTGAAHHVEHLPRLRPDGKNLLVCAQPDADDPRLVHIHLATSEKILVAAVDGHVLRPMGPVRPGTARIGYPAVSVVIPTRNEAKNLEIVLPAIAALRPAVHEIVVVDGNSTDDSIEVARRVLPSVKTITQTRTGKGNAMACGFAAVTGDVVVMFDADGSADPAEIPRFVAALVAGADFAKGSRFAPGGGSDDITLLRRTGNSGLNRVANALFGTSYTDLCYGYNAFWADCRIAAADLKITEVPSVERRRMFGHTNLRTFADGIRVLRTLFAEHRRKVTRYRSSSRSPVTTGSVLS
ncbi:glycosyltransferase family 2 protein [Pseudonocardia lacus]|uniref:glycosyltransferase family 2 protein n=1 Tax=Pseudonocardia lacus TaxID=2835865 RepID=UPI0020298399|nr:glycosyltransferase family 2 protein [Pseudonocardia lacus]